MDAISFTYKNSSLISSEQLQTIQKNLKPEIEKIKTAIKKEYSTEYASINCINDPKMIKIVKKVAAEKKLLKPTILIVVGIGGSHLGTAAIHQAVYGKFYNEQNPEIKVYFADSVDSDYIYDIILLVEQEVEKGHTILVNVISKSGNTTETIANFEIFLNLLQKYKKNDYHKYIVITTEKNSNLWNLAQEKNIFCLEIPDNVGGRYSVFSPVGLFPLALLDIDIDQLIAGAQSVISICTNNNIEKNIAALHAALMYLHNKNNKTIHDTFIFSVDLQMIGAWYRQLLAESIGKQYDRDEKEIFAGITPTISIGSSDLHSVAQLYLGGPNNIFTTFITVKKNKSQITTPNLNEFEHLVEHIQSKPLSLIMDAIFNGTTTAYKKNKRPFVTYELPEKSPYYLGQLLQCKMIETMYLGFLVHVNPFNQPHVELYKKETRKILAHE